MIVNVAVDEFESEPSPGLSSHLRHVTLGKRPRVGSVIKSGRSTSEEMTGELGVDGRWPGLPAKYAADVIVCVPITEDGQVDPRWGRADWIGVANVTDGEIESWQEIEVSWSQLHDEGTPARHHARVARFLREKNVEAVIAHHVGEGMVKMLDTMHLPLFLEASGDARAAVLAAIG